jgi:TPP-dependent pyruvate/acetoin dehydrogenase alpha subunit
MHLCSKEHRVFSSGIVGASLPAAAGFALAAKRLRPKSIAVAQAGDGSLNQGMALETLNLATAWSLPLLIVCIDNGWAITAPSGSLTGGELTERARSFGLATESVDGGDLGAVHTCAAELVRQVRRGKGPAFLHATAPRMDGHYLGDLLMRASRDPLGEGRDTLGNVMGGALAGSGGGFVARAAGLAKMMGVMKQARSTPQQGSRKDPIVRATKEMERAGADAATIEAEVKSEIDSAVEIALEGFNGQA